VRAGWSRARADGSELGSRELESGQSERRRIFFIFNLFFNFILKITQPDIYLQI